MQVTLPWTPPAERTYAVPTIYRVGGWSLVGLVGLGTLACLAVPWLAPGHFGWLYAAFAGTLIGAWLSYVAVGHARRMHTRFTTDETGLVRIASDGTREVLPWDRIERVRQRPFLQRLDVHDRDRGRVFRLEYQLDGFEALAELLGRRVHATATVAPAPARGAAGAVVFRGRRAEAIASPLVVVAVLAASWHWAGGILIGAALLAIGLSGAWLFGWRHIRVGPAGITVEALVRSRHVPADRVRSVEMVAVADRGNRTVGVAIELADGSALFVSGCREGDLAFFRAMSELQRRTGATAGRGMRWEAGATGAAGWP